MKLDDECRSCLYTSQLKKVEKSGGAGEKFEQFKTAVKAVCDNSTEDYCAPLLARDINMLHFKLYGKIIDYSAEKSLFNSKLLALEPKLYSVITASPDPIAEALKYAMAANYIDFARLSDVGEEGIDLVISAAKKTTVDDVTLREFKQKLRSAKTLCVVHDNCGEIVLDKILIRVILDSFPHLKVYSMVRGKPVINDVTEYDAREVGLDKYAEIVPNGSDVPGTYLKEISAEAVNVLKNCGVLLAKGLGNLETMYGNGLGAFYAFCCKCAHISERFGVPLWQSAFIKEL